MSLISCFYNNNLPARSLSVFDGIDNMGLDLDLDLILPDDEEKPQRPHSLPPAIPPISTENTPTMRRRPLSSTSSIKQRLRIAAVSIKDYPSYVKMKRKSTDLFVEWEVRICTWMF